MKQRRKPKPLQTDLFLDLLPGSGPVPLDLPADRQGELQRLIGELLLKMVREDAANSRGGENDE